jgi:hypothetical protein
MGAMLGFSRVVIEKAWCCKLVDLVTWVAEGRCVVDVVLAPRRVEWLVLGINIRRRQLVSIPFHMPFHMQ